MITAALVYVFTRSVEIAALAGAIDVVAKLIAYVIHERAWGMIRFGIKQPKPVVIWLTGLSGSGKSTLAEEMIRRFPDQFVLLDGDALRAGLCSDLGFSDKDRKENQRRLMELCKLYVSQGKSVITAFISPFEEERQKARLEIPGCYVVHVHAPIELCEERDPKGLYAKVRRGEIKRFTGVDSTYQEPEHPDLLIDTNEPHAESFRQLQKFIKRVSA